ncbi:MAG: hypothetical protein ACTSYS_12945 [Promethearchaeota archaeon]
MVRARAAFWDQEKVEWRSREMVWVGLEKALVDWLIMYFMKKRDIIDFNRVLFYF